MPSRFHFSTFLSLLVCAVTARAQTAPAKAAASDPVKLDRFEVSDTKSDPLTTVSLQSAALPAAVDVIEREDIERTNFNQDFGALLRRVPGIVAHNIGQGDTGTSFKMRGFLKQSHGADAAAYVDGVAQNLPSGAIAHGMNDLTWLMPDMIERIEVIKGPFSALYGDQNRSGTVNIVTRASAPTSLALTAGGFGMFRATALGGGSTGGAQTVVCADYFHADGYRDHSAENRNNVFAKVTLPFAGGIWSARAHLQKSDWEAPGFLFVTRLRDGSSKPTDRDLTLPPLWGDSHRYGLVLTRTPAGTEAGVHGSAEVEHYDRVRAVGANLTDINTQEDRRVVYSARVLDNVTVGDRAAVAFGAETRADVGNAFSQRWLSGVRSANYVFNYRLDLLAYGFFAQGQYKLTDTLKVVGGARFDGFDYTVTNRKFAKSNADYTKTTTTPRVGLAWAPKRGVEFFTNYGEGFRSPAMTELSPQGALAPVGSAGGLPPVTDIKISTVESYDAGTNIVMGRWQFAASAYHTLNGNEIIEVPAGSGNFQAVGDTSRDGWEVEARVRATPTWTCYASYGKIIRATINNPLPNTASRLSVPADTIKGGVAFTASAGEGRVLVNVDAFYISGVPYFAGTPLLALQFARPYSRYDVRATYERRQWQFTVGADFQPMKFSSDAISAVAAGLTIDPRPTANFSSSVRYRF